MDPVFDNLDLFWSGFLRSLGIIAWAAVGSLLLGTVLAAFRVSPVAPLRAFGTTYVHLVRNCPLTVVLFFFAFGLPEVGINQSYYLFGVAALVVYTSAFVCEAVRSGVNSVSAGQAEAARAIGLTFTQSLSQVILPQALRSTIPPLGSVIIAMIKNSAVVGVFGVGRDLFSVYRDLTGAGGQQAFPVLVGVAACFLMMTIPAGLLLMYLEKRLAVAR